MFIQGKSTLVYPKSGILLFALLTSSIISITFLSEHKAYSADCWRNGLLDSDCDGLANQWENQKWYDENGDNKKVPLPASVKWNHKDVLVEIDTMVEHENLVSAIDQVKSKFLAAPVTNLDNVIGINLVVILDKRDITHTSCTSVWSGFQSLKNSNFGTSTERSANPNIVAEKEDVFHYGVAIHSQCGATGVSGNSELKGNDFVISLGDAGWGDSDGDGHPNGNINQQAATFMHELGHNLNLKHGGSTNTPTCKPNYFSVMNHIYEFSGFVPQPLIDYSNVFGRNSQNALIDENSLDEPYGIVGPSPPVFTGAIGTSIGPAPPNHFKTFQADGRALNYDWEFESNTVETNVSNSFNYFAGYPPCILASNLIIDVSAGFKDWPSIMYWDPPEEPKMLLNQIQLQTPESGINNPTLIAQDNNTINSLGNLSSNSGDNLLGDPSLPPCDVTDPICSYSPCDPDDPNCNFRPITNITDPSNQTEDIGNRTAHSDPDVSIADIKNVSISKIMKLDSLIQSASFINSTIKNSLHKELIIDAESIVAQIQSNAYNNPILKLLKLRSLIEVIPTGSNEFPEKNLILNLIDDAANQLKNML